MHFISSGKGLTMLSFSVEQVAKSAVMSSLMSACLSLLVIAANMSQPLF